MDTPYRSWRWHTRKWLVISSNPNSSNPTRVAFVVHPISLWGEEMHVMSFRVRRNIFPFFEQNRQNRHEMTRAGVVQKAPDTFLRGAYLTPVCLRGAYWTPLPTDTTRQWHAMTRIFFLFFPKKLETPFDRHDTAMTRSDTYLWKQLWWNQRKMHLLLWIPHYLLVQDLKN